MVACKLPAPRLERPRVDLECGQKGEPEAQEQSERKHDADARNAKRQLDREFNCGVDCRNVFAVEARRSCLCLNHYQPVR